MNQLDNFGRSALSWAAKEGRPGATQQLLYEGASIDVVDIYGKTILMLAAEGGDSVVIRTLMQAGAEMDITSGLSPTMVSDHLAVLAPADEWCGGCRVSWGACECGGNLNRERNAAKPGVLFGASGLGLGLRLE